MDNFQTINEYISGCDKCSDYEIVQPYLALTCNGKDCIRQINDHAGVGIYYVDNNLSMYSYLANLHNKKVFLIHIPS